MTSKFIDFLGYTALPGWQCQQPLQITLLGFGSELQNGTTSDNGFIFEKINEIENIKEKKNPVGCFGNNPIYPLLSIWINNWTEPMTLYEESSLRTILKHFN